MKTNTVKGYYGSNRTQTDVFTAADSVRTWYVCEGSVNVNITHDAVNDGVDVEELNDIDCFTWPGGIHSEEELIEAIEA